MKDVKNILCKKKHSKRSLEGQAYNIKRSRLKNASFGQDWFMGEEIHKDVEYSSQIIDAYLTKINNVNTQI